MAFVPTVTENEGGNRERSFDIYSRLLKDRIILIGRPIDDVVANLVVAQLMYLAADDPEKEIQIYINSPGGAVSAGFAIYDTMQYVQSPISTVCIGRAASFGTVAPRVVPKHSVQGDYDGDGKADLAVYRPSTGSWFISRSTAGGTACVRR